MELRLSGDRAVLAGLDDGAEREVDPGTLPLGRELTTALHQWAQVVTAVLRIDTDTERATAGSVVSDRGKQLTSRVAAALGVPVAYRDPLTGELTGFEPPPAPPRPEPGDEPTPWATGLTVSAFVAVVVLLAVVSLASTLADTAVWLAFAANVVVTAGLLPSVWLARAVPTWRWVAYGVGIGIALSWFGLVFVLI